MKRVPLDICTGCAACLVSCVHNAIEMVADHEGFLYPQIDDSKCTQCGNCTQVCPVESDSIVPNDATNSTVYAGWAKDREVLLQSTSGGIFSEIAFKILDAGGVVFGAAYDDAMTVKHIAVEDREGLAALRGSKYVQSDVNDTYRQACSHLKAGRSVLYTGTPCQIAGLKAVVGQDQEHLLTCDVICHGVPSPKVFKKAIDSLEKRYKSKVIDYVFREKSYGWLRPSVRIDFDGSRTIKESNMDNPYNRGFLKNIYLRPACYQCPVKSRGSYSDMTIGDFWQLLRLDSALVQKDGTSVVIAHTQKGFEAVQGCAERLWLKEFPFDYIENGSNLKHSVLPSPQRAAFFADLDQLSFDRLTKKYMQPRSIVVRKLAHMRRTVITRLTMR